MLRYRQGGADGSVFNIGTFDNIFDASEELKKASSDPVKYLMSRVQEGVVKQNSQIFVEVERQ